MEMAGRQKYTCEIKLSILIKKKISRAWCYMRLVPATWEAERQGDHLSPGGRGCSEPSWHHCTPAWVIELDPVSKKKGWLGGVAHADNPSTLGD